MMAGAAVITVFATALTISLERRNVTASRIAKMVASTGFIVVALSAGALDTAFGSLVVVALALSWLGDLLLSYPAPRMFLFGLITFLLGHVAYVAAFSVRGLDPLAVGIALAGAVILGGVVLSWLMPSVTADMRAPVVAYTVVISAMVVTAIGTHGQDADWRIPIGATLFYASDIFVARNRFVASGTINRVIGLPLYYSGQLLLAWSAGG